jgi:hypothetical protein
MRFRDRPKDPTLLQRLELKLPSNSSVQLLVRHLKQQRRAVGTDCGEAVRRSAVLLRQTQPELAAAPPAHLVDPLGIVDAQTHLWQQGQGPLHADTSARGRAVNQRDRRAAVDAGLPAVANPHFRTSRKTGRSSSRRVPFLTSCTGA